MRPAVSIALVVVGLAAATYGTASLTGGWLGTPPWWEHSERGAYEWMLGSGSVWGFEPPEPPPYWVTVANQGREWISGGVVAVGLALIAFGAWGRRGRSSRSHRRSSTRV